MRLNVLGLLGFVVLASAPALAACDVDSGSLSSTQAPDYVFHPPAHPGPDCPFYQAAWNNFLWATREVEDRPAFLSYASTEDIIEPVPNVFAAKRVGLLSLAPRTIQIPNVNDGIVQAGGGGILVDAKGRPIYYAIHVNDAFTAFLRSQGWTTPNLLRTASATVPFPQGVVEMKSAWQIVDPAAPPATFIVAEAIVPTLKRSGSKVVVDPDAPPRRVTVALLALHIAFVQGRHSEMVWSTFEHAIDDSHGDLAPVADSLPTSGGAATQRLVDAARPYQLYAQSEIPATMNNPLDGLGPDWPGVVFDVISQSFQTDGRPRQTSVFRAFPASKLSELIEDDEITLINMSVRRAFLNAAPSGNLTDRRSNYRLVGATWFDLPDQDFRLGQRLIGPMVAGEDALSSLAMESFTQSSSPNCFSCHDARKITNEGETGIPLIPARLINVSHVISRFLFDQNFIPKGGTK